MSATGYNRNRDRHGRHRSRMQSCRDCGRRMFWVTMPSGRRNPLNLEQLPGDPPADVLVVERRRGDQTEGERWILGITLEPELAREAESLGMEVHSSHFADEHCPGNQARIARAAAKRGDTA